MNWVPNGLNKTIHEKLKKLNFRNKKNHKYVNKDMFRLLIHLELWISAYQKLSMRQRFITSEVDQRTIDGTSLQSLIELRNSVLSKKFKWTEIKCVYVLKPNKRHRPLGIAKIQDRVVQQVLHIILSEIYEPIFLPCLHGFRPKKSPHTALQYVRRYFRGVRFYIKKDITKYLDSTLHDHFIGLLKKKIDDYKFLNLIRSGIKLRILLLNQQ
jgi:retron-type reverse transcriptase